jgi:hypothetical protein
MNANLGNYPSRAMARVPHLAKSSHGLNIADVCAYCTVEVLEALKPFYATVKLCKGCSQPIGHWVDYCGQCTSEDETDCW